MGDTTYVALLRGVNVGGRKVPMATVREALTDLGYAQVRTYLQSGNAVFRAPKADPAELARSVEAALTERFGMDIPVVVLTAAQLADVVAKNPFPKEAADPTRVVVSFLGSPVPAAAARAFDLSDFPEQGRLGKSVLYLHYPHGQGRSKLVPAVLERRLAGTWSTARNWRTVLALRDMTRD